MMPGAWRALAVLAIPIFCVGCGRGQALVAGSPEPYRQPDGWSTECYGRFLVDVPGRLEFGAATPEFYEQTGATVETYSEERGMPFGGGVSVAGIRLTESAARRSDNDFKRLFAQADHEYTNRLIRAGGASDAEEESRRRATQKHALPDNGFIWRHKSQFDFGTLVRSDMRARMLHGDLSGEGSLAQAKAVVDALWPRYRPRNTGEIPGEAGICTPYGFFADPAGVTERDYGIAFKFPDVRHSNLVLRLAITTHSERTLSPGERLEVVKPETMPSPWEEDAKFAKKEKEKCRPQQGTASRDLLGCLFAGLTNITAHRDVAYLTLANGQRARLLVMEYRDTLDGSAAYEVRLEAPGDPNSAVRPWIDVSAQGMPKTSPIPGMGGKEPPSIDEAVTTVRTIAASLRLRPGAVAEGAQVKDTLEGVR
jgi:hypothetical protein